MSSPYLVVIDAPSFQMAGRLRRGKQRPDPGSDLAGHLGGAGGAGLEAGRDAGAQPRGEPLILSDLLLAGYAALGRPRSQPPGQEQAAADAGGPAGPLPAGSHLALAELACAIQC